jgi:chromosome segregation ATPase
VKAAPPTVFSRSAKTTTSTQRAPAEAPATKASKGELRSQVGRLEQLVASYRAKSREANKAAKAAAARISELEGQVAQLERRAAAARASSSEVKPGKPPRAKRRVREIDPGDAVPPGVAVEKPAPLDAEAEAALENLEEHLGHD